MSRKPFGERGSDSIRAWAEASASSTTSKSL
jgi:hypothetical protein